MFANVIVGRIETASYTKFIKSAVMSHALRQRYHCPITNGDIIGPHLN